MNQAYDNLYLEVLETINEWVFSREDPDELWQDTDELAKAVTDTVWNLRDAE